MSTTIEDIISRGYWRLIVRPTRFNEVREESLVALDRIVREKSVRLRGWDFPHYDNEKATAPGRDFIEQEINWHHHKEKWRLYQSGQFILLRSLWEDWEDQALISSAAKSWVPGKELWVLSTIFTLAELCEFAARLAVIPLGGEGRAGRGSA